MEQPKNSKIKITKTNDALDIYIPPPRFRCYLTTVILVMEFIFSFPILLMAYGVYAAEFPFKIACAAFSLPFLAGAIGMGSMLPNLLFSSTSIHLNSQQININFKSMFDPERIVISAKDVRQLRCVERHTIIRNPNTKYEDQLGIAPDIVLQAEDKEYKLSSYSHFELSEVELDWLAYEISIFWKLPITQESFETISK